MRWLAFLICLGAAVPAVAAPKTSETLKHYLVQGDSFPQLRRSLAANGPNGFWGYTKWWITWSSACQVTLEITITMPKLAPGSNLTASQRRIWDGMVKALYQHEQMHAEHGRRAADEILASKCDGPHATIEKWAKRDRVLDRETRHGAKQGVQLPK